MKEVGEVNAHEAEVSCLHVRGNTLYSGSVDGWVKVWKLKVKNHKKKINI